MFHQPDHQHNLSLRLSQVLDEIGVNQEMVTKSRRSWMLREKLLNIVFNLTIEKSLCYNFGSQTEGSTSAGLNSDVDILFCHAAFPVIQDWSEWQRAELQFLMIQDDTTSPGYCLLQVLGCPPFVQDVSIDNNRRVLLRQSFGIRHNLGNWEIRHGPAQSVHLGSGRPDFDFVTALHCSSWPKEAYSWLQLQNASGWPTEDMKRYSAEQGCFLVPVSSRTGIYQDVEWRISTSFAERYLMWSLNITQIRCYILMKMIIKTFLKPRCEEAVSSFMCKSVLFHCIANSQGSSTWNESTLISRLNDCLQVLLNCLLTENCPHFILPRNNLLAGKLSAEIKPKVVEVMCMLTENIEQSLLGITIDKLGHRLRVKSGGIPVDYLQSASDIAFNTAANNIGKTVDLIVFRTDSIVKFISYFPVPFCQNVLSSLVTKLCQLYCNENRLMKSAISLLTPFLCTYMGSILASVDIQHSQGTISDAAMLWFSLGLNSDISSSRLKLASALYCVGDLERCEIVLGTLERKLSQPVIIRRCVCNLQDAAYADDFGRICYEINEKAVQNNVSLCVKYLPCELNCIPKEMKYEMFRSTEEDRPYTDLTADWMDWAVVDSLSYLHFLQYKVYSQLQRPDYKVRALYNLAHAISHADNLGHKETALNLLGQCMEQENRTEDALFCYTMSLNVRARNNAAKWHICGLLARLFRG